MKKFMLLLFTAAVVFLPQFIRAEAQPPVQFCENFDEQWQTINPGNTFNSPNISWIATSSKPYGMPRLTVSIYKHMGAEEQLIKRSAIDVNPIWDTTGIRHMALPGKGEFTVSLTTPEGAFLNSGRVIIVDSKPLSNVPNEERLGTTLKTLFNKYTPKN